MAEIIGVRFKSAGKIYYFDPDGQQVSAGDQVIVETSRGTECGEVVTPNREVPDKDVVQPLKKLIRVATKQDLERLKRNREKEAYAFQVCLEKIRHHKLDMKLIDVEYTFDNSKILFYFTADGRVDFRELVKDLASVLKTRIELRQIGVRDEAKMLGGLGICGRPFCCSTFLGEFQPVSIKMAKEQGLSLNPAKISGTCGRLMCCLKYEQAAYEDLIKTTPKVGAYVQTPEGRGVVTEVSLLTGYLKVALEKYQNGTVTVFHKDQVRPCKAERKEEQEREENEILDEAELELEDEELLEVLNEDLPEAEPTPKPEGRRRPRRRGKKLTGEKQSAEKPTTDQ